VKRIIFDYENSKFVNFTLLSKIILGDTPLHVHKPRKIKRKHGDAVASEQETKEYKVIFKKRRLMDNFDSFLSGYL
jgi:hypothetical protein